MSTRIRLMPMPQDTPFAPLGVLGYCLVRSNFLAPVFAELHLPLKTVDHAPTDKLLDVLISILAGCRTVHQINTRVRPDLALSRAWGRERCADQSTIARMLDTFSPATVTQLRLGIDQLFRRESRTLQHAFERDFLWLDIDLTPLPASKHAQGSTKGHFDGKKTAMADNWRGLLRHTIMRRCSHVCTQAIKIVVRPTLRSCEPLMPIWDWPVRPNVALSCALTRVLGPMPTSTMPCDTTGRWSAKPAEDGGRMRSHAKCRPRRGMSCAPMIAGLREYPIHLRTRDRSSIWRCAGAPKRAGCATRQWSARCWSGRWSR